MNAIALTVATCCVDLRDDAGRAAKSPRKNRV
nr:MAG TPA: hypothetical protein [Caudoviricetes sp.]